MITSSIANSGMFKNLANGSLANKTNRLHIDLIHSNFKVIPYCQKFNNGDTVYFQFISDSATPPELAVFNPAQAATAAPTSSNTITGNAGTRYYYNFTFVMTPYNNSSIYFTLTQGAEVLTSEPFAISDLSEDIENGRIKYIKYNNLDRANADLSGYFIDWSSVSFMFFYIEAQDRETNPTDESEVLEGVENNTIISANLFAGKLFNSGVVPEYMVERMAAVSSLDVFLVNDIQYIKEGEISPELYGGSTSFQVSIALTEKNAIGINVDDLGIDNTEDMEWHKEYNSDTISANLDIAEPDGYLTSNIMIQHAATSVPASTNVKIGYTVGGDEIADITVWKSAARPTSIDVNLRDSFDAAGRIYFTFSGAAGYVLRLKALFQLQDIA